MLIVLDTNCWIDASRYANSESARLLAAARRRGHRIAISKHSLSELVAGTQSFGPDAEALARDFEELPYFPIGRVDELLGTIDELSGTIVDIKVNDALRERLGSLAKRGTDIRDRGALIDAIRAGADCFVTSDRGLVSAGPRKRLESALPIRVCTPTELLSAVGSR